MNCAHTFIGAYLTQSVLHAFMALILVEVSFYAWEISDHLSKFRYRLLTLGLPIIMFPLFQLLSPERGSWHFRLSTALFDSQRWLDMKVLGLYPFSLACVLVLAGFSVLFAVQEVLPLLRNRRVSPAVDGYETTDEYDGRMNALLEGICSSLRIEKPAFLVIRETFPILFTQGFRKHTIIISDHLVVSLGDEQLRAALAHEAVHMMRSSNLKTPFIYLLRMAMFYNPVSLVEFRRIVHDDEFICDAITVSLTGNPGALIEALSAFYYHPDGSGQDDATSLSMMKERVESHSHNLMLDERIARLQELLESGNSGFCPLPFFLTASVILLTGYLVV